MSRRPRVGFLGYADVFEDFYPHYGVDQHAFATRWAATGNHALVALIQREIADVVWYELSLAPALEGARHESVGCRVRMLPSSWAHRRLWQAFYGARASWRWRERGWRAYATAASYLAPLSRPLLRALREDRPDVLLLQDYATGRFDVLLAMARLGGCRLVAYHAGSQPSWYLGSAVRRWTLRAADHLVVSNREERARLVERCGVRPDRVSVVLTPIDTARLRPLDREAACRGAGLDPARRHLLFVGRLEDRVKRVGALVRAFAGVAARHPGVDLLVVGDGPDGPALRRLAAAEAAGRVRFLGWVEGPAALARAYAAADCLVLPSWSEGFPTVIGEAMACGTPVLASRVGGVPELVTEGVTGWLLPPGDDAALAAGLARVAGRPEEAAALRPAARATAEARVAPHVVTAQLRACLLGG